MNHITPLSLPPATNIHDSVVPFIEEEADGSVLGSETSDSDGNFSFLGSDEEDDDIYAAHVDLGVCDDVTAIVEGSHQAFSEEDREKSDRVDDDSDGLKSLSGSEGNKHQRYPEFNPLVDFKKPICLTVGMRFGSNDIFRKALRQYSIQQGGDYYYLHNDNKRVSAYCKYKCDCDIKHSRKSCVCKNNYCKFKACASRTSLDGTFQLKSFFPTHDCGWKIENKKVTSVWLAEKYLEHYRDDPNWTVKGFIATIRRDYTVEVSYIQAWRARLRALLMTQGDASAQYAKVWDYVATLRKWSSGSSAFVKVNLDRPERPLFQRLYVCLDACKRGFLMGCRPIIGLDGCHLRGAYTGQLLCAIGKDGNENLFPIAYAVVEAERKETWFWFLENLMSDLGEGCFTFISDRQKGLIEALHQVVPLAETRVCVRHLYNNFRVKWPGKGFKDALWYAARACNKPDFNEAMEYIKSLDEGAYKYLMEASPNTWSRHGFMHTSKSDMQLNNVCESFNNYILEAREKPILSMCEWIRRKLMKRFLTKREGMSKNSGNLTPSTIKKLEKAKEEGFRGCRVHYGGDNRFEVDHMQKTYVVDLSARSCGCNKWDLTGIPCPHAMACITLRRLEVEEFVDDYYTNRMYMLAYNNVVHPMPGEQQWEQSGMTPPDPPKFIVQPGRPKKARRKKPEEEKNDKQKRHRNGKNKCSNCGVEGHSKPKCTNPPKTTTSPRERKKGGRPKNVNTIQVSRHTKKRNLEHGENPPVAPSSISQSLFMAHGENPPTPSSTSQSSFMALGENPSLGPSRENSQSIAQSSQSMSQSSRRTYLPLARSKRKVLTSAAQLKNAISRTNVKD